MTGWWVHDFYANGQYAELVSQIFWVIFAITLHELAHGWAAIWQGDQTPRQLGRMTMNPMVHMGPWSLLIFAFIGIAWGLMPTDPSRYRWGRRGRIVVAAAGPAMNVLLAIISLTLLAFWQRLVPQDTEFASNVTVFFFVGGYLNLVLAIFNMLPVPPLDGSNVLAGLSFRLYRLYQHPNAQFVGLVVILLLFLTRIGDLVFFGTAGLMTFVYTDIVGQVLDLLGVGSR